MSSHKKEICSCSVCEKMLYVGDWLAEHKVFDCEGDLDYIELAHEDCARWANISPDTPSDYWEMHESRSGNPVPPDDSDDDPDLDAVIASSPRIQSKIIAAQMFSELPEDEREMASIEFERWLDEVDPYQCQKFYE